MTTAAIRTEGLTKHYGRHIALTDLNLEVGQGEVFGFLGPNVAGKSTTIRILLDLIRPTAGRVEVFGVEPRVGGAELRKRIGYLPGELEIEGQRGARLASTGRRHDHAAGRRGHRKAFGDTGFGVAGRGGGLSRQQSRR
ncbi:ATP-binding cassette domain-containing protein [Nocardia sp. NPDC005998]|uniref:ATP-binding cassette domain-containing protein n=1 Tax=Nocardia sp. NPDC005998 TaxID=3156894 RepID=UPI0033B59901